MRGLILTAQVWTGVSGVIRRPDLRGLSSAVESVRFFLRGVRLTLEAAADSVCFLLVGVETS